MQLGEATARDDVRYVELADAGTTVVLVRPAAPPRPAVRAVAVAATEVAATIEFTAPGIPVLVRRPAPPRRS